MSVSFNLEVPRPASSGASSAATSGGGGGQQAGSDKRGKSGKSFGKQSPTEAQIAANDVKARLQAQEAELKLLEIEAKKAEARARIDKAKSGASSAPAASTPRAQGGRGGGEFVTHDQFQEGINSLSGTITKGFDQVFSIQSIAAEQQALTNATLAGFVRMMGTNGTGLSLPAPVSRQIGNDGAQEVPELHHRMSYRQNVGGESFAEGSGRFATSSSDISQRFLACGGGSQEFNRESVTTARIHRTSMSSFEAAARRWNQKGTENNTKILQQIRNFTQDDKMRCLLLALVNGKTLTEIVKMYGEDVASLLTTGNTPFFQNFFTALTKCGLPSNFNVKVDAAKTRSGHEFLITYLQLSQAPGNVDGLVTILRGE